MMDPCYPCDDNDDDGNDDDAPTMPRMVGAVPDLNHGLAILLWE